VSVDALLGRQEPDDTTLTFALRVWNGYADDAEEHIGRAQGIATDILEMVEDGQNRFDLPAIDDIHRAAQTLSRRLHAAQKEVLAIKTLVTDAVIANPEPGQRRKTMR
jgi:hypothetical protein